VCDFSLDLHSAVPLFHSHGMQHQHSLRRPGWSTSPAEVNHKSSSKANLLVYNLQTLFK